MKLDVQIERLVDLMTQVGVGAAERQHDTDLNGLGLRGAAHCEGESRKAQPSNHTHRILPTSLN